LVILHPLASNELPWFITPPRPHIWGRRIHPHRTMEYYLCQGRKACWRLTDQPVLAIPIIHCMYLWLKYNLFEVIKTLLHWCYCF
jgi:hypothetical protein